MREALSAFFAPSVQALQFAIKTLLAGGLALWCAFRFGLEQPQWALMTAFIVAQPLSGMVVQKGLARLLGTLIGASMSVLMIALFAQAPWLFLIAVALWMGLCTAASTMLRSAWSYAFVLAGYTVAIIGLPAISHPLTVFDQAVARGTEIALGIACATVVSAVLWPQRVERQLAQQARSLWQAGVGAASQALAGEAMARQGLLDVLGRMVAVDAQREHAWFEGQRGRQRAAALRLLSRDLLGLLRLARGVGRQWRQLDGVESLLLAPWMQRVRDCLAEAPGQRCATLAQQMREVAEDEGLSAAQRRCLERLALLVLRLETAAGSLLAVEQGEVRGSLPPALSWHRDWQTALLYGSRSALAFLALAAFWMATAWPAASGAMLLASVVCSLFASRENAAQIGLLFLRGIFYALPVAFFVGQILLPQLNGFVMLCLALGVPLFFGALGMAKPALGATATSFCLHFIVLCAPQNDMNYDLAFFFNEAQAMLIGVACAVLAFNLIGLRSPRWHGRRLLQATLRDLARLTRQPLLGAESWFGGRMADRLMLLARHYPALPSQTRSRWDDGIAGLDLGDELLHLRACLAAGDRSLGQAEERFLDELRRQLLQGPAAQREEGLDIPTEALLQALRAAPSSIDRRLAEAALLQLQAGWRRWCQLQEKVDGLA
ncbi:FUSC family protein [Pseudomonas sp. AA-38]|uniref:FUSC family protein n=1 Tax=Pseudomonas sp. AA-38 TaxID=3028807 RepID=UPI0023FA28F6|nr:FUSC family protein [Pseudomonas sp. AA-38]